MTTPPPNPDLTPLGMTKARLEGLRSRAQKSIDRCVPIPFGPGDVVDLCEEIDRLKQHVSAYQAQRESWWNQREGAEKKVNELEAIIKQAWLVYKHSPSEGFKQTALAAGHLDKLMEKLLQYEKSNPPQTEANK